MLLDLAPVAAMTIALLGFGKTLVITLVGAHLAKTSDDPKVLERYAKVVEAMRGRPRINRPIR